MAKKLRSLFHIERQEVPDLRRSSTGHTSRKGVQRMEQELSGRIWTNRSSVRRQKKRFIGGEWTKDDFLFTDDENANLDSYNICRPDREKTGVAKGPMRRSMNMGSLNKTTSSIPQS